LLLLDSDNGTDLQAILAAVNGYAALVYSTHSHLSTTTSVSREDFEKSDLSPEKYLMQKKFFVTAVAARATVAETEEKSIIIQHNSCPKFGVVMPMEHPWRALDFANQDEATAAWSTRYLAAAEYLGLIVDESCADTVGYSTCHDILMVRSTSSKSLRGNLSRSGTSHYHHKIQNLNHNLRTRLRSLSTTL
jgi:hypothetical protein